MRKAGQRTILCRVLGLGPDEEATIQENSVFARRRHLTHQQLRA